MRMIGGRADVNILSLFQIETLPDHFFCLFLIKKADLEFFFLVYQIFLRDLVYQILAT